MDSIRLRAMGKVNLSIDIKGILDDGYHDVEMVMQSVNLSDKLLIRKSRGEFFNEVFQLRCTTWKEKYNIQDLDAYEKEI